MPVRVLRNLMNRFWGHTSAVEGGESSEDDNDDSSQQDRDGLGVD